MELSVIKEAILNKGYYEFSAQHKAILDMDIYARELNKIKQREEESYHKGSFYFAMFRSNLLNYGLGGQVDDDYKLYLDLLKNRQTHDLQKGVLLLPEQMKLTFSTDKLKDYFESCWNSRKPLVLTSFHFSSYKLIINYLSSRNCDIYLLATQKVIKNSQYLSNAYLSISRELLGYDSTVTYINAEEPTSLIYLINKLNESDSSRAKVLLVFPDGNIGTKLEENNTKNKKSINFLGTDVLVNKGILFFASVFDLPVFKVLVDSNDYEVALNVTESYSNIKNEDFDQLTSDLFKSFESMISRSNIIKWECIMYLHNWLANKPQPKENKEYITSGIFDDKRFTKLQIDNDDFLFDSKYYLSYAYDSTVYKGIKDFVLDKKIAL